MTDYTEAHESALLRALRDVNDGHLTLWVDPAQYDMTHGQLVPDGELRIIPDRTLPAGIPDPAGRWWLPLLRRGWVDIHIAAGRPFLRSTTAGLERLTEVGL